MSIILTLLFFHDVIRIYHFDVIRLHNYNYNIKQIVKTIILLFYKVTTYLNMNANQLQSD